MSGFIYALNWNQANLFLLLTNEIGGVVVG